MRYVVYGAGAIGGVIGGRLHQHGHDVVLIARGAHHEALRATGLRLVDAEASVTLDIGVVEHPSRLTLTGDDVVVLAMKTQDTEAALRALAETAPPGIAILCAQNGVENERLAARRFAGVYGMCVMMPATHLAPGEVLAYSSPTSGILDLGCYPAGVDDRATQIAADLEACTFSSRPDPAIMRAKWAKLRMNLSNALEALSGTAARGIDVYQLLVAEFDAVVAAAGIDVATEAEDQARRGDLLRMRPIDGQKRGGGSTWQSLARGTGSLETDHLNGEIVLLGRIHGVPTPVNAALQRAANDTARAGLAPGSVAIDDLIALLH